MADVKHFHKNALTSDLRGALDEAARVLRAFGLKEWRLTLVVRHPTHPEEFVITGDDDNAEVAKLLEKHP